MSPHNGNFFKSINNSLTFTNIPSKYICVFAMRNILRMTIMGYLMRVNLVCFHGYYKYTIIYWCLPSKNGIFLLSIWIRTLIAYTCILFCRYETVKKKIKRFSIKNASKIKTLNVAWRNKLHTELGMGFLLQ